MNLVKWIFEDIKDEEHNAVMQGETSLTYKELIYSIKGVSKYIVNHGYTKGDNIILISPNSADFIISYLGVIGAGCKAIPLPYERREFDRISYIADLTESKMIFIDRKIHNNLLKTHPEFLKRFKHTVILDELPKGTNEFNFSETNNVASILFTSGSTKTPKGVIITHKNIISNSESIIEYLKLSKNDVMMLVMPLYYCYGLSFLYTIFKQNGTLVINNDFMFPAKVLNDINRKKCTGFAGVPSHFQILLRNEIFKKIETPSLRFVTQAGGKLGKVFIKELMEALPSVKIFIMYGQTEATARLSYLEPSELKDKLGSIGKGMPGTTLEVLNKNNEKVKPGKVGEIVASGDNITEGYYKQSEETIEKFKNKKLYTGDLATVDEDGYIYIVDRESSFIKTGGHRVSTKEIEETISQLPYVVECAVVGVIDDLLGEAIKVFVVVNQKDKKVESEIKKWCNEKLATYKCPKFVAIVDEIPKTEAGKVSAEYLKDM